MIQDDPAAHGIEDASPEQAITAMMETLRECPPEVRHAELVAWTRSPFWHPLLMMALGWHGELAREAYRALRRDLAADTPGRRWDAADPAVGRTSIIRLLGLSDAPGAAYAAAPFRTWVDDDDRNWIAGAIGSPPYLNADAAMEWLHLDIRDVVLWDPRTNDARLAGEHPSESAFVMPDMHDDRLTIWGDCGAFFQAWAHRRSRTADLAARRSRGEWSHPIAEPRDGNMPGGLLIGSAARAPWPHVGSTSVVAAEGITAGELHFAAVRCARLPAFGSA